MFLEEYKYDGKEKKMPEYITNDISFDNFDREDSDYSESENSNEESNCE